MIPEYLFKQAEREANAAMMKELYTEGSMEPAVAGMDPEEIDPEVAAAINTILGKLQKPEEPEERHTVEKASGLRGCIFKVAEDASTEDVNRKYQEKLAVLSTNPLIRKAFRQLKSLNDKYLSGSGRGRFSESGPKYNHSRNMVDWYLGASNLNPGWSDIIQKEGKTGIVKHNADVFNAARGQIESLNDLKHANSLGIPEIKGSRRTSDWVKERPTQQDIDDYMEARHMLYKYLHSGEEAGAYRDSNSLMGKLKNWQEGWDLIDPGDMDYKKYDKAIPFTLLR